MEERGLSAVTATVRGKFARLCDRHSDSTNVFRVAAREFQTVTKSSLVLDGTILWYGSSYVEGVHLDTITDEQLRKVTEINLMYNCTSQLAGYYAYTFFENFFMVSLLDIADRSKKESIHVWATPKSLPKFCWNMAFTGNTLFPEWFLRLQGPATCSIQSCHEYGKYLVRKARLVDRGKILLDQDILLARQMMEEGIAPSKQIAVRSYPGFAVYWKKAKTELLEESKYLDSSDKLSLERVWEYWARFGKENEPFPLDILVSNIITTSKAVTPQRAGPTVSAASIPVVLKPEAYERAASTEVSLESIPEQRPEAEAYEGAASGDAIAVLRSIDNKLNILIAPGPLSLQALLMASGSKTGVDDAVRRLLEGILSEITRLRGLRSFGMDIAEEAARVIPCTLDTLHYGMSQEEAIAAVSETCPNLIPSLQKAFSAMKQGDEFMTARRVMYTLHEFITRNSLPQPECSPKTMQRGMSDQTLGCVLFSDPKYSPYVDMFMDGQMLAPIYDKMLLDGIVLGKFGDNRLENDIVKAIGTPETSFAYILEKFFNRKNMNFLEAAYMGVAPTSGPKQHEMMAAVTAGKTFAEKFAEHLNTFRDKTFLAQYQDMKVAKKARDEASMTILKVDWSKELAVEMNRTTNPRVRERLEVNFSAKVDGAKREAYDKTLKELTRYYNSNCKFVCPYASRTEVWDMEEARIADMTDPKAVRTARTRLIAAKVAADKAFGFGWEATANEMRAAVLAAAILSFDPLVIANPLAKLTANKRALAGVASGAVGTGVQRISAKEAKYLENVRMVKLAQAEEAKVDNEKDIDPILKGQGKLDTKRLGLNLVLRAPGAPGPGPSAGGRSRHRQRARSLSWLDH